jgi:amino acid transporter
MLGRDGILPKALASVHPRFHTPWAAIAVHALVLTALASTGQFSVLIVISNVAILLLYLSCAAAAYRLQRAGFAAAGPPLVLPGGPLIPLAASAAIIWLLAQATSRELGVTAAVLLAASILYAGRRKN